MRNYFNQHELSHHLIIMTAMVSVKDLMEGSATTLEEKKSLKKVLKLISDFSESVYARLGEGYKRSLKNKATLNTLKLVSRNNFTPRNDSSKMEDVIERDYLCELLDLSAEIECAGCERIDCKNCGIYKIKSYLHYEGKSDDTDLCPFRQEKLEIKDLDFEDF